MVSKNYISQFERIERRVMDDFFRYAPETMRSQLGLQTADVADGCLYLAGNENNILLNRILGWAVPAP